MRVVEAMAAYETKEVITASECNGSKKDDITEVEVMAEMEAMEAIAAMETMEAMVAMEAIIAMETMDTIRVVKIVTQREAIEVMEAVATVKENNHIIYHTLHELFEVTILEK